MCKTCGPASWVYASKVTKIAQCSWCGTPWPTDVPRAPWREPSRPRPRERPPSSQFEQAGFKKPAPKTEDVDLLSLLQRNRGALPPEILNALPEAPAPNPVQEGKAAGVEFRNSVGKLRDLGQRKLKLQEDIDNAKANLKAQDLQQSLQEAQAEVNKTSQEYEAKVLTQCFEEANHGVDSVLQALGITEEALTEAQKRSIEALKKETADEAKRRKTQQQQQQFPPGLAPPPPRPEPPAAEGSARDAEVTKGPPDSQDKARSRSPKRAVEPDETL